MTLAAEPRIEDHAVYFESMCSRCGACYRKLDSSKTYCHCNLTTALRVWEIHTTEEGLKEALFDRLIDSDLPLLGYRPKPPEPLHPALGSFFELPGGAHIRFVDDNESNDFGSLHERAVQLDKIKARAASGDIRMTPQMLEILTGNRQILLPQVWIDQVPVRKKRWWQRKTKKH